MPTPQEITPYENDQVSKKGQVTNMFDKIAPYYDQLNRFLSLGIDIIWRKKTIKLLKESRPESILDIATGTGDLAIEAANVIKPKHIIGVDISVNMLNIGKEKIAKKGLQDVISLEVGDSENLRFDTNSFDAVTAAFGVRNFGNIEKGLSEMYRVLKPGGTLAILEFSKPRVFPLKQGFNIYFKNILPIIGKIRSKDPRAYQYLYESVQAFPDYEKFITVLDKVGFHQTNYKTLSAGICCIYFAKK
jgi:demethylmenaquinone methyltransferase/2-methoxy-6-polyprenyl-1,4-benzoquinol methylase